MSLSAHHRRAASRTASRRRAGFTLFEIAISLVIAAFGVISVIILFPIGIKAEQLARMRIYAAVKAEEMVEEFANTSNTSPSIETEAPDLWEVPCGYRVMTPDLESRISAPRFGIMPLPTVIANRLDSDNDEIQSILSQGGNLYYSQAQETSGLEDTAESKTTTTITSTNQSIAKQNIAAFSNDNQTQKLVFAVTGYAQNNNVAYLAWKDWPYYSPFPSPPGHGEKEGYGYSFTGAAVPADHLPGDAVTMTYSGGAYPAYISLWEGVGGGGPDSGPMSGHGGTIDTAIAKVFSVGYQPYDLGGNHLPSGALLYFQSALWYCDRAALPSWVYYPVPATSWALNTQIDRVMTAFKDNTVVAEDLKWRWVQAVRFLSHSATCLTRHYNLSQLGGQPSTGSGLPIPAATIDSSTAQSPALPKLTHDLIVYYHELAMRMGMLYFSSQPYDWGVPRPTQRAVMTDYPLIEYDLLSPPLAGTISGTASIVAQQWRPLPAHPIANIGRSYSFPDTAIDPNGTRFSTVSRNFTLAKPFAAAERCRQLVFWTVDWQSYQDFETAPSAPVDASKYLFSAPMVHSGNPISFDSRMGACLWPDHHIFAFRNPEKIITFTQAAVPTWATGADVSGVRILSGDGEGHDKFQGNVDSMSMFLGRWGADRNFNGKLDRGPIPTSVRLRATLVSRYNFYDPRLTLKIK